MTDTLAGAALQPMVTAFSMCGLMLLCACVRDGRNIGDKLSSSLGFLPKSAIVSMWARVKLSGKIVFPLLSFIVWQMVMKYVDFQVWVVGRVEIGGKLCINHLIVNVYTFDCSADT